jgi:transposase
MATQGKILEWSQISSMFELSRQGYSVRAIARRMSVSTSTVRKYLLFMRKPSENNA